MLIVGFSSILAETADTPENHEYIRIIEDNNYLLLQLINDILDLSRIEAGLLNFCYTDVDVNSCIRKLEDAFPFENAGKREVCNRIRHERNAISILKRTV
ncbi:MAG: histidine kinase dimerization/phospho-acceptor domain-containing protein [Bacteroides cellulosilyticus]